MGLLSRVVLACVLASAINAYPGGAPLTTCNDLTPHHGELTPQVSASPYVLVPALQRVQEGNKLRLVLNSENGDPIAGFMVQAKSPEGTSGALGVFTIDPEVGKTLTCGAGIKNTLTHGDNKRKKSVEVEWEPPAGYEGPVVFNSTFVKDGATFWVGVETDPVHVVKRSLSDKNPNQKGISTTKIPIRATTVPNYTPPRPVEAAAAKHPIYTGCDDKKLCFAVGDCISDGTCSRILAISSSPSPPDYVFTFEMLATNNPGYVAMGLSYDDKMGDDSIVQCTNDLKIGLSAPKGYTINILSVDPESVGIKLIESAYKDGILYCKFTRNSKTTINNVAYDLRNTKYNLLLAQGPYDGEAIQYHDAKEASSEALALTEVGVVGAKSKLLLRLHGAFMLAAWIGFAGTGMLVARYFKKTWVGKQTCGKDIWFSWHRAFMVITWVLTNAGFIIIFVEIGGWYGATDNPHAVLGVITTALCFVQPIAATFRPMPSSPRRPLFNWGHWLLGNLSHLLGVITIFFARQLSKAELPEWVDWIVSAYVAFHVVMHIIFSLTDCISQKQADKRVNNMPMKEMGVNSRMHNSGDKKRDAPQSGLRKFLLGTYLLVVCALTIALIVVSSLAPIEENETVKKVVNFLMPNN